MNNMTRILDMDLIYRFFDAVNMHRWNDHLRPLDLTEIDKQAHKAAIAWVLGKYEEECTGRKLDWRKLIEDMMFSFLKRTVLTDLKPQLLHKMEKERLHEVNVYVISEIEAAIPNLDPDLFDRFKKYLDDQYSAIEDRIVSAAHYLATNWEFNLIYDMNKHSFEIEHTRNTLNMEMSEFTDMVGVKKIMESKSMSFIDLVGQLRFQQRWTRIPRIPATTVLGHSLIVANMMFLHDLDEGVDDRQLYNDFFTALFHDLPEVLTKDVISPVKVNVEGLVGILDEYEHELVNSKIMPLIPESWHDEFRFLTFEPFAERDDPVFGKANGYDIKMCDVMGAYIEARVSRGYGMCSSKLKSAEDQLRQRLEREGSSIHASELIQRLEEIGL